MKRGTTMEEITCPVCDMNHHGPYRICEECRDGQELPDDELVVDDEDGNMDR